MGGGVVWCCCLFFLFFVFLGGLVADHLSRKTKSLENGSVLLGTCLVAIFVWHRM